MNIEAETASIVMLGSFNPSIFQPSWLASKGLITDVDASQAIVEIIAPQVSSTRSAGIRLMVLPERFHAQCDESIDQVRMRDLVVGVFSVLAETPVTRLGLNWNYVVTLASDEAWHRLGDELAPKPRWSKVLPRRPGMKSIVMNSPLEAPVRGEVNVKVEPVLAGPTPNRVSVDLNFDFPETGPGEGVTGFRRLIEEQWPQRRLDARHMAEEVVSWSQP
jgi:hypothetical protein